MSFMEIASYMMFVAYTVSFLAMSAIRARGGKRKVRLFSSGSEPQVLPPPLFRLDLARAVVEPVDFAKFRAAYQPIAAAFAAHRCHPPPRETK